MKEADTAKAFPILVRFLNLRATSECGLASEGWTATPLTVDPVGNGEPGIGVSTPVEGRQCPDRLSKAAGVEELSLVPALPAKTLQSKASQNTASSKHVSKHVSLIRSSGKRAFLSGVSWR